ncbi:UbiX family flavin prenyltransferase [Phorcysia thermohydrogeniphila]|uniref:Flavin prenyltransferase UbiX n=1 Tax=Phorcysia thermohydrogeniphila TaxID=936138 RepID=A0A4R1GC12_9BACT|nr:UbiX family flavin prenyltransferase [Phorcysia thermohydrogeniphila]TCK05358.1 4-hydroxy-3-polyprenylbenzoate decarboxylase [Phorcysia thermohydrogeniphila]
MERIVVGITGASGSIYGKRTVEVLVTHGYGVDLIFSETGKRVFEYETGLKPEEFVRELPKSQVNLFSPEDLFAPPSSGSYRTKGMVIIPCSAGTLGHIANGVTSNLIHRAADVTLKEKRPLVLVFRETPVNRIHVENMLKAIDAGATVLPACPGFYGKPSSLMELVDFVVEKALRLLTGRSFNLTEDWKGK